MVTGPLFLCRKLQVSSCLRLGVATIKLRFFSCSVQHCAGSPEDKYYLKSSNKFGIISLDERKTYGKHVYSAQHKKLLLTAKLVGYICSSTIIVSQPWLISNMIATNMSYGLICVLYFAMIYLFCIPIGTNHLTKRYVLDAYYNHSSEEFTVTVYGLLRECALRFHKSDIQFEEGPLSTIKVGKRHLMLHPELFTDKDAAESFMNPLIEVEPLDNNNPSSSYASETAKKH